jgi:alpha-amylase/alpha-mannosidase (GH57 family)
MSAAPLVELVLVWHQHQPDYRDPRTGSARLPWVRLHATKDYLDMARRLEPFPGVKVTFNFVPSLIDQLEAAAGGAGDDLFDLLARDPATLTAEQRSAVTRRCLQVPPHALARWAEMRRAHEAVKRDLAQEPAPPLALECWFLLAWLDPSFLGEPEAVAAMGSSGRFANAHREGLLALHARLLEEVVPAHKKLAARGQLELSASPYYHPILPLLVDVRALHRARPDLPAPRERFMAPEDARRQLERALERHRETFGTAPAGVWPSEGAVSPEVVEMAASLGVRWMATDEAVLHRSLGAAARPGAHFTPWRVETPAGDVTLFFRDHELSDRIGFVYQRWDAAAAVEDFLARLRRIGRDHAGPTPPVVSVILDGENCWEGYADDGGPFLDGLYASLDRATDIRTATPGEVAARPQSFPRLGTLHSGSWIDADFHIWAGHPEKNRAWELVSRARAALAAQPDAAQKAWEALMRAEGSDWFWWFGDDHYTPDKSLFDELFRGHLRAVYELSGLAAPVVLDVPIAQPAWTPGDREPPVGFIHPALDGRSTHFYEWQPAGHLRISGGRGAAHARARLATHLYYGFDLERLYLRVDFAVAPKGDEALRLEVLEPSPDRVELGSLVPGPHPLVRVGRGGERSALAGAECRIESILEMAIPFAAMGWKQGDPVQLLVQILEAGRPVETLPEGDAIRFECPDESFDAPAWSP